jgi:hypothetical protein
MKDGKKERVDRQMNEHTDGLRRLSQVALLEGIKEQTELLGVVAEM